MCVLCAAILIQVYIKASIIVVCSKCGYLLLLKLDGSNFPALCLDLI